MPAAIPTQPFGRTGHASTRVLFGAAALGAMQQDRADRVLELLLEFGINHLDTAASYGESELRLAPWLRAHPGRFFVASKTGDRGAAEAAASIRRSLDRLGIDRLDLIQLHDLTDEAGWQQAMGPGGALEACIDARSEGLVRFIGVTGHGTQAPRMHLASLDRFDFDSVLAPYSFVMMRSPDYAADFERLAARCRDTGAALQTIKSVARRRWPADATGRRFSWYEPLRDAAAIRRAVHFVLAKPEAFLNSSSDATLLRTILEVARDFDPRDGEPAGDALAADATAFAMEPLFVRGISDAI
jgi:aryl-alcohol dehydrogenase-like predicted oxidoreductase